MVGALKSNKIRCLTIDKINKKVNTLKKVKTLRIVRTLRIARTWAEITIWPKQLNKPHRQLEIIVF